MKLNEVSDNSSLITQQMAQSFASLQHILRNSKEKQAFQIQNLTKTHVHSN